MSETIFNISIGMKFTLLFVFIVSEVALICWGFDAGQLVTINSKIPSLSAKTIHLQEDQYTKQKFFHHHHHHPQKASANSLNYGRSKFSLSVWQLQGNPCTHESMTIINRYSSSDWLYNVFSLPRSIVLKEIRNPVFTIAIWSQFVSILHFIFVRSSSQICRKISRDMCIGKLPHTLLVSSLGLLLVFRTNSAYQRFAEGRKIWEQIHSVSRNISRLLLIYEETIGTRRRRKINRLLSAFPYLLSDHISPDRVLPKHKEKNKISEKYKIKLRVHPNTAVDSRYEGDKTTMKYLKVTDSCYVDRRKEPWNLFSNRNLERVVEAKNRPLWACDQIAIELSKVPHSPNFTSRERLTLIKNIDLLSNAVGECERIHQTAVPLNYARHSLRSLTLWLITLPFVLLQDLGLLTGLAMGFISWVLFGVYQIGYGIEDPFQGTTLRLSTLCKAIKKDILDSDMTKDASNHIHNETTEALVLQDELKIPTQPEEQIHSQLEEETSKTEVLFYEEEQNSVHADQNSLLEENMHNDEEQISIPLHEKTSVYHKTDPEFVGLTNEEIRILDLDIARAINKIQSNVDQS